MVPKTQKMVVMRHALRQDELDPSFVTNSSTWWDPPLAPAGFKQVHPPQCVLRHSNFARCLKCRASYLQAEAVSGHLQAFDVKTIIASPFQRCLQTANTVWKAWNRHHNAWHVDCKLCEVSRPSLSDKSIHTLNTGVLQMLTPRNLNFLGRAAPSGHIQSWMWQGNDIQQAIQFAIPDGLI